MSSSTEEQFIEAARTGDLVKLHELLAQVDPKVQDSKALAVAAMNARLQAALVLYPLSDPQAIEHWCHLRQGTDPELILRMVEWARTGRAEHGHSKVVDMLIPVSEPQLTRSSALCLAAKNGHRDIVALLIPFSEPKANDSEALRNAARRGHKEIVEFLLPFSVPKALESAALSLAANNGHKEIVEMLIPVSEPKAKSSQAIGCAALNGHKEVVEMLLPFSDPKANDSEALRYAAGAGYGEIVELLAPVSDIELAINGLRSSEDAQILIRGTVAKIESLRSRVELDATTFQISPTFRECVDQAKSSSQETMATQRAQARRL